MDLNALSLLLKYGAGASHNLRGANLRPQQGIAAEISNLSNAQYNQDNPLFQQIYGQERNSAQQDLASVIAEMTRQNRKQSALGRTPLFDQERGGETQFRALTQGYQDAQNTARTRAREILSGGQKALTGAFNAQNSLSAMQEQNKKRKLQGIGNIADILPIFGGMF